MKEKYFFLFFCMIFVAGAAYNQKLTEIFTGNLFKTTADNNSSPIKATNYYKSQKLLFPYNLTIIQPDFYSQTLGFFCKKEWQLVKNTRIPFKIRLGSVEYCDWMEGKK